MVGTTGLPPAEDGCVLSVMEAKLSEAGNGVNISCKFLVVCKRIPTCAKDFNLFQVKKSQCHHVNP